VLVVPCIPSFSTSRSCRRPWSARDLGPALRGHLRLRALPHAQRDRHTQVLPAHLARRAEAALSRTPGHAGEELEVLRGGHRRTPILAGIHGRLPDMIRATATPWLPGTSFPQTTSGSPARSSGCVIDALASLDLRYPEVDKGQRAELAAARKALRAAREPPAAEHAIRGVTAGCWRVQPGVTARLGQIDVRIDALAFIRSMRVLRPFECVFK